MVLIHQVSKRFASRPVLDAVSLTLEPGRTHVLLGSSGSGKTTLLKLIAGTLAPDAGTVTVDGVQVVVADPCPLADRLGYMTQEGGLFPHLRAGENITLVARVRRWKAETIEERLTELTKLVGLDRGLLASYPAQLSGGQRQRIALVRALFLYPKYVLLDEPLGALDPIIRRELQGTLTRIFTDLKMTVILVTHDVGEAAFFGDTVTLLYEGRVLQHGNFEDLALRPAHPYVTEFLMAQRPVPQLGVLNL